MPEAGFEPTITTSERAKTVRALHYSGTVAGNWIHYPTKIVAQD
jgi:hypothetical protein